MMVFPEDYKVVGISYEDPIEKLKKKAPIYFATKYMIAYLPGGNIKIIKVETEPTDTLLR